MTKRILLVEDEENFGSLLSNYLTLTGYEVTWKNNGAAGYSAFMQGDFHLCILDVMMPNMDGFTLASKIKEKSPSTPLIFLTAKNAKEDMVAGYRKGADDYLTKPFDTDVLLLKINAILNRAGSGPVNDPEPLPKDKYEIGSYTFHPAGRKLVNKPGEAVRLSPKEALLLELLCQHQNKIMSRELALKKIWGENNYFTKRSMDVYITKLRKYLSSDQRIRIDTYHQMGFQLRVE